MRKLLTYSKIKATLGIAVIAVALAWLAPPTAQAQTESYITAADEAAACEGVCNTYVPPQTEDECRELAGERWAAEYERNNRRVTRIQLLYNEAIDVSREIAEDELKAIGAIQGEAHNAAKAVAATAIAGAKAKFSACVLAASALPSPADFAAVSKCIGWHALAMAGIITAYNRSIDAADARWRKSYDIIQAETARKRESHRRSKRYFFGKRESAA